MDRFLLSGFLLFGLLVNTPPVNADPESKSTRWFEGFTSRKPLWKKRWFYRLTNAESYYYLTGNKRDLRPIGQTGLWLSIRGRSPVKTARPMRLLIKPGLGAEASYISFGLNSHYKNLTVRFIDRRGRVFAISCVPKTRFYVYTWLAVKLKNGLRAIEFDAGGGQIPGWINIANVEAIFGEVPGERKIILHEKSRGRCIDQIGPYSIKPMPVRAQRKSKS